MAPALARQAPAVVPRFGRRARPRRAAVARTASAADAEQTEEFVVEGDVVTPEILVVGLGPGNPSQVTVALWIQALPPCDRRHGSGSA